MQLLLSNDVCPHCGRQAKGRSGVRLVCLAWLIEVRKRPTPGLREIAAARFARSTRPPTTPKLRQR